MEATAIEHDPRIAKAVEIVGSQKKLAAAAGCEQQTISKLLNRQRQISAEMAVALDRATFGGVPKHLLRPDLFDPPIDARESAEAAQ